MAETVLLATLREYSSNLSSHLSLLRERHQELETAWARLRELYEGEGAEVFGEAFEAASRRVADYSSQSEVIARQLGDKIEQLQAFEAAEPGL